MRIVVKGGVWKNTEDEILKAAIGSTINQSKYGKNQWARISSLLVRKTPKQCKARWMEWLDPAIKKTEWSKEEDEKLLHLAKLMPTQWRTIAPIVGRTANQCLERYQKLLDEAEQADNDELGLTGDGAQGPSADDVRRLRPGEVDPDPENRPARPDPIDMDEDEKEMLSEARARLANTQGKKAKRKARERQLEEARRLAMLQKKRELKAAGIFMRPKPNKKGMDYMADIPFEKQPAPGFYDTTEEQNKRYAAPINKNLRQLEGQKRKQDIEEDERRKKQKQRRENKDADAMSHFVAAKDNAIQQQRQAQQITNRRRLVLPGAQVGEAELEEIVKIGQAGENARAIVDDNGGNDASQGLLGEYSALGRARDARTPRTAPQHDNVMAEARNIRNLSMQQTPLLGEENTPMHELVGRTGFEGVTPARNISATPNPLATPFRSSSGDSDVSTTPMSTTRPGATPLRTPMRDNLAINDENSSQFGIDATPRQERHRLQDVKSQLRQGFASLPTPANNFELVLPEDEVTGVDQEQDEEFVKAMRIEDAADREARLQQLRQQEEQKRLARRNQSVKRGLPRPVEFDAATYLAKLDLAQREQDDEDDGQSSVINGQSVSRQERFELDRMIAIEMVKLLEHDAITYPVAGSKRVGGGRSNLTTIADEELNQARQTVHQELAQQVNLPGASETVLKRVVSLSQSEFDQIWQPRFEKLTYSVQDDAFVDKNQLTIDETIQGLKHQLEQNRQRMHRESGKAAKVEKKLGVVLGGYMTRSKVLGTKLSQGFDELSRSRVELESFARLAMNEQGAAARRIESLRDEVETLERRERDGQAKFRELIELRDELQQRVQEMELDEAERINEAALAGMEE
ncbi:Pre-mRNA-splicing factor cef1 [Microbotryomycetes sp. JL221]|nr:Pre-mRNA-splicing factor cef1 [Microbotryomycetes sp. JL221]